MKNLFDAGCQIVGFVHTDEMTYSIHGENYQYGATLNPIAPDKVPGGSSNGSASAVSMGLVDIALGSDTFGSVRVPAHYQGIYGIKPTQNRISLTGACALGASLDTVGWFTRDPYLLEKTGAVLLSKNPKATPQKCEPFKKIIIATDYFNYCDQDISKLVKDTIYSKKEELEKLFGSLQEKEISKGIDPSVPELKDWYQTWYYICGYENWNTHKDWIQTHKPLFGEYIGRNIMLGKDYTKEQYDSAMAQRTKIKGHIQNIIGNDTVIIYPTAPVAPIPLGLDLEKLLPINDRVTSYTCIANFGGFSQISMPVGFAESGPCGMLIFGNRDTDEKLLQLCVQLSEILGLKQLKLEDKNK